MMQQTIPQTLRRLELPPWLPATMRRSLAGKELSFELPRSVKQRLRQPEKIRVSEWAEKYRMVADGAHEGAWRHDYAPHTVKIMDTFGLPWVREVWFCGVEQSGKTNTMMNCMAWAADCDPGNIFYLMPTEDTAKKVVGVKIRPTFQKSPRLARYLSRRQDDTTLEKIALTHGVNILAAWANSASSMATFTAKHCFGDEIDKYPQMAGKEADPITLIKKRNRNYKGRYKRFFASTPAGLYVYKGVQNCHQLWEWRVKCPDCGELVRMDAEHLDLAPEATPESVERDGVEYACSCGSLWGETAREQAIRAGRWVCVKGAEVQRPAKVGFHHRAWECLDVPLTEIAAAWLKAKGGDHSGKVAWANGYEAIDYEADKQERKEAFIERLCDDRPEGLVPSVPISAITCLADMQKRGFWYTIRAWGYGLEQESWLLKCGFVDNWEGLRRIMFESQFKDVAKNRYVVTLRGLDSGGGEGEEHADLSKTAEAYLFAAANPGVILFKGRRRMSREYSVSDVDRIPGSNKALPGSAKLYTINTTFFKDKLAGKLMVGPSDPGAWHVHSGYTADQLELKKKGEKVKSVLTDFCSQMVAEYRNEQGYYECPKNKANHLWDCSQMEQALVEIAQIKMWPKPEGPTSQAYGRRVRGQGIQA